MKNKLLNFFEKLVPFRYPFISYLQIYAFAWSFLQNFLTNFFNIKFQIQNVFSFFFSVHITHSKVKCTLYSFEEKPCYQSNPIPYDFFGLKSEILAQKTPAPR